MSNLFWVLYILSVIYCIWRMVKRYKKSSLDGITGYSPGLDLIVALILAPILAPIDIIVTVIQKLRSKDSKQS